MTLHHKPDAKLLQVFEGFLDFLSYLTAHKQKEPTGSVLVLNSTNLWRRALPHMSNPNFEEIRLYLDNDTAGDAATKALTENGNPSKTKDMRNHYANYEDLNAWLLDQRA